MQLKIFYYGQKKQNFFNRKKIAADANINFSYKSISKNMKKFMISYKKISIITVTKNSQKTIETAIKSFIKQDYKNKELILIDGKSSDKTISIINKYKKKYPNL